MNKTIAEKTVSERFKEFGSKPIKISLYGKAYTISKFYSCFKLKDKNKRLDVRLNPDSTIEQVKNLLRAILK